MQVILFFILIITVIIAFGLYFTVKKVYGFWVFLGTMIVWLVPPYPLAIIVAHFYDGEGLFAGFDQSIMTFVGWYFVFPIIAFFVAYIKLTKIRSSGTEAIHYNHYLEYGTAIFIGLLFLVWLFYFR